MNQHWEIDWMTSMDQESTRPNNNVQDDDRITSLPDDNITLILSSIDTTEDLIRTRGFSRHWMNSWTRVPFIDIDWSRRAGITYQDLQDESLKDKFQDFVNWVITKGDQSLKLNGVTLNCFNFVRVSTLGGWIHAIINRNAKVVDLSFCSRDIINREELCLPTCLVLCDELSLCLFGDTLGNFYICKDPHHGNKSTVGFLKLNNVELSNNVLGNLLSICPFLEDLRLVDCFHRNLQREISISCPLLKILVIDNHVDSTTLDLQGCHKRALCGTLVLNCPNLLIFDYRGHVAYSFELGLVDNLKTVAICPQELFEGFVAADSLGSSLYSLLLQVSKAASLEINHCFLQCIEDYYETNLVRNLNTLMVKTKIDTGTLNVLVKILKGCANLKSLDLTIEEVCLTNLELYALFREMENDGERMKILTGCLTSVAFLGLDEDASKKVGVARMLLAHASALESMVLRWDNEKSYLENSEGVMRDVSKFFKASSCVKVNALLNED